MINRRAETIDKLVKGSGIWYFSEPIPDQITMRLIGHCTHTVLVSSQSHTDHYGGGSGDADRNWFQRLFLRRHHKTNRAHDGTKVSDNDCYLPVMMSGWPGRWWYIQMMSVQYWNMSAQLNNRDKLICGRAAAAAASWCWWGELWWTDLRNTACMRCDIGMFSENLVRTTCW